MLASSCPVLFQSVGIEALFFQGFTFDLCKNVNGAISEVNAKLYTQEESSPTVKAFWHFPYSPLAHKGSCMTGQAPLSPTFRNSGFDSKKTQPMFPVCLRLKS